MARNEEKAQSMLYRFREAQAAELGISTKTDRRPRLASSCQDLRQCERWRGEILREISRKVSKIQDAGLTDYEVRDLNDEINKLLREKGHWETQIINLGGANYRRIGSSTFDGAGRSAPGQRGYKYFGRAKELPGVKELFEGATKQQIELDSLKKNDDVYPMFKNQGPSYFGDLDEYGEDGKDLLTYESTEEKHAWQDSLDEINKLFGLSPDQCFTIPFPTAQKIPLSSNPHPHPPDESDTAVIRDKRKSSTQAEEEGDNTKKARNMTENNLSDQTNGNNQSNEDPNRTTVPTLTRQAASTIDFSSVLDPDDLKPPPVPSAEQWEKLIMGLQKAALMKEYVG
ncbi:hypothetical protein CROQUDRAFT_80026 [Cronartium quercuum f. sp. fusiforme G11]|uniref:Pre-mRNA-splicing factor ISY1 n=1 Tax=Cronartium quercuum f. sp. fusiforme G11 TaxID=708437 RepID=A0A9P6NF13_9BASI|nr:hypothetical protein CROQUDRAFT_80026 [Cronartium quercuum f. sp. fusiforme G11]